MRVGFAWVRCLWFLFMFFVGFGCVVLFFGVAVWFGIYDKLYILQAVTNGNHMSAIERGKLATITRVKTKTRCTHRTSNIAWCKRHQKLCNAPKEYTNCLSYQPKSSPLSEI
jgi:hypothetical protein